MTWVVDATFVGHDLNQGHQQLRRRRRARSTRDPREDEAVREMVHAYEPDGPQLDSAGDPVTLPAESAGRLTRFGPDGGCAL